MAVARNHTSAIYTIALCISRTADAEWGRACGCVSKFAPIIGRVGELRAYLEGGWAQNIPSFLRDGEGSENEGGMPVSTNERVNEMGVRIAQSSSGTETDSSARYSSAPSLTTPATSTHSASTSPSQPSTPTPLTPPTSSGASLPARSKPLGASGPPPTAYFPHTLEKLHTDSVRSIESLSSFPSPPTHFPLPNMMPFPSSPLSQKSNDEAAETATPPNFSEAVLAPPIAPAADRALTSSPMSMEKDEDDRDRNQDTIKALKAPDSPATSSGHRRRDSAQLGATAPGDGQIQQRKSSGSGEMGRSESVLSTNNIVASMRDKWGRAVRHIAFTCDALLIFPPITRTGRFCKRAACSRARYSSCDQQGCRPSKPLRLG